MLFFFSYCYLVPQLPNLIIPTRVLHQSGISFSFNLWNRPHIQLIPSPVVRRRNSAPYFFDTIARIKRGFSQSFPTQLVKIDNPLTQQLPSTLITNFRSKICFTDTY